MSHELPCNVIQDMIPLVKDNVASQETIKIVTEHIDSCEGCKTEFNSFVAVPVLETDDKKNIKQIKKHVFKVGFFVLVLGAMLGVAMSFSSGVFYNFYIMPLVGALGYLFLRRKCFYVPIGIFVISYIWMLVINIFEAMPNQGFSLEILVYPLTMCFIYVLLVSIGVLIGWLIHFAFKKEEKTV